MAAKRAMCLLLYGIAKGSFRMLGKLFGIDHAYLYRRIRKLGEGLAEPEVGLGIREMRFDEMWHFIGSKKTDFGSSKPWIVAQGEPWSRGSAVVMRQLSGDFMTR
jgi:hypothetical protein